MGARWRQVLRLGLAIALIGGALQGRASAHDTVGEAPATDEDPGATPPPPPPPRPGPEGPPRPTELFPRVTLAETVGWLFVPEPTPDSPEEVGERWVDRMIWEHAMRDSLEHVGADGWYYQVGNAVRRSLRVDMRAATRERRRGMNVVQRLVDELGRYADGPSAPQGGPATPTPELRDPTPNAPEQRWHDQLAEHNNLRNAPVRWHRVEVRVVQAPDGDLLAVWVIRSSGNSVLDRAVITAVRAGITRVPPPPREIVGDRRAIASEWAVEIGDVATYINQAGCVMQPEGGVDCAALGRGIVRSRVRLLRVLDEQHPSFEEARRTRRHSDERRRQPGARQPARAPRSLRPAPKRR